MGGKVLIPDSIYNILQKPSLHQFLFSSFSPMIIFFIFLGGLAIKTTNDISLIYCFRPDFAGKTKGRLSSIVALCNKLRMG